MIEDGIFDSRVSDLILDPFDLARRMRFPSVSASYAGSRK